MSAIPLLQTVYSALEKPPIVYTVLPIPVEDKAYHPGDSIEMRFEYCVRRSTRYTVSQRLVNVDTLEEFNLPQFTVAVVKNTKENPDCRMAHGVPKIIPEDTPSGLYKMVFTSYSDGRFGGAIEYNYESEEFFIQD